MKNMITSVVIDDTSAGIKTTLHVSRESAYIFLDKYVKDNWHNYVPEDVPYDGREDEDFAKKRLIFFSQDDAPFLHINEHVLESWDEDATEVVIVPKWVHESLNGHTETLEQDVASGVQSGMYDDERNHDELLDMQVAGNYDPELSNAWYYHEQQLKETHLHYIAKEFVHDTCIAHGWSTASKDLFSLDEFLLEFPLALTEDEKYKGGLILKQFETLKASQQPVLNTVEDLQDHYGLEWVDYVECLT